MVAYWYPSPGLTIETAEWFHARDVAAVATDTATFEVYPSQHEDAYLPVHLLHLVEMGMTQGQNWVLDPLAEDCAADGRYTFLLDATPLPLTAGPRLTPQPAGAQVAPRGRLARSLRTLHCGGVRWRPRGRARCAAASLPAAGTRRAVPPGR